MAFADIYEGVRPSIIATLMRYNVPHNIAEELTQDAAINCWRAETERGLTIQPGYFMRAALSRMIDWQRKKHGVLLLSDYLMDREGEEYTQHFSDEVPAYFDLDNVKEVLAQLTTLQARVAILRFCGYRHQEIAELLPGMTEAASKKLITRAKKRLRRVDPDESRLGTEHRSPGAAASQG